MQVTKGRVLGQRFFDIADEIDLERARALVQQSYRSVKLLRGSSHVRMPDPPIEWVLDAQPVGVAGYSAAQCHLRLYDFGAVSVTFLLELPSPIGPEALVQLSAELLDGAAERALTDAAWPIVLALAQTVAPASRAAKISHLTEDYTIFWISQTRPRMSAEQLRDALDIPRLLLGERGPLDAGERAHLNSPEARFTYGPDELVVIDWNSALIVDAGESWALPILLEISTVQLFELRVYDLMLERFLANLYEELDPGRSRWLAERRYQRVLRQLIRLFIDVREISDRIDNALQFLGDSWLARVHRAAVHTFEVPRWQAQLRHKLDALQQFNQLLVDQVTTRKGLRLEWAIVLLIVVEILFGVFKIW